MSQQKHKREDEGDAFLTLVSSMKTPNATGQLTKVQPDKEIAGCISDIGLNFTIEDLRKPNPQQIQKVFEWFAELLTSTTREVVAPAMQAAAKEMCGDDNADRIFTPDTRELIAFFVTLRRLLLECGIKDFTFSDLYRPVHPRLVKIFSYIINFIRFRESQTDVIDEHHNSSERTKNAIEQAYHANQDRAEQLEEMQRNRTNVELALQEKEKRTRELRTRLLELKASQERVTEKLEAVKTEQAKWKSTLEERNVAILSVRQETGKLRPYIEQSPAALEQSLRELSTNLNRDRQETERLDRRGRALQVSFDTFVAITTDIASQHRLLSDIHNDLQREDEELAKANKNREALAEQTNTVREVERQEKMLRKQLEQWRSRTERLRTDAETKALSAKQRLESLRDSHKELSAERRDVGEEVEKRRIRIEQTEKKVCAGMRIRRRSTALLTCYVQMTELKESIEREVQSARDEYMKMESHIRLYITEMEQSI